MRTQGNFWTTFVDLIRGIVKGRQICFIARNVYLGKNVRIGPLTKIENNTKIGNNTFIGYGCIIRSHTAIGNDCSFGHLTVIEGELTIGNRVRFHAQCHVTKGTVVEDDVFFAPFYLGTNTKNMTHGQKSLIEAPIIKKGAKIGAGVIITPGITINENSIIGAGSVVTKNVQKGEIWFGNPAKKRGLVPKKEWL